VSTSKFLLLITMQYLAGMQFCLPLFLMHRNELKQNLHKYIGCVLIVANISVGYYRFWTIKDAESGGRFYLLLAGFIAPFLIINYTESGESAIVQQLVNRKEQDIEFNHILDSLHENVAILVQGEQGPDDLKFRFANSQFLRRFSNAIIPSRSQQLFVPIDRQQRRDRQAAEEPNFWSRLCYCCISRSRRPQYIDHEPDLEHASSVQCDSMRSQILERLQF
jgi:hypothetical protein